jgi:DNA invertase Pin-like site-specific DNA recombinase
MSVITADIYLRLSGFRQDDADSFPAREKTLRVKAADLGWTVGRVIVENDVDASGRRKPASAFKRKKVMTPSGRYELRTVRPGWRDVLADLTSGAANALLAEDLDRVARDPRDIEDLIDAVAACRGHARSVSGSLMLTNGGTSDQVTVARIMCTVANKASADTARRVADGRERAAAAGSYGGGKRPYGFRHDPDAPKYGRKLIIVPDEAAVIRACADAVLAEGEDRKSLRFLAAGLRESGTPTVTGVPWSAAVLKDVLVKPALAGIAVNTGACSRVRAGCCADAAERAGGPPGPGPDDSDRRAARPMRRRTRSWLWRNFSYLLLRLIRHRGKKRLSPRCCLKLSARLCARCPYKRHRGK